jgi:hypothetical protein
MLDLITLTVNQYIKRIFHRLLSVENYPFPSALLNWPKNALNQK